MVEHIQLKARGLAPDFDIHRQGDQPIVTVDAPQRGRTRGEIVVRIGFTFPGFTISDDDQETQHEILPYKEIGISGAGFISEKNMPLLPCFGRFLQIPANYEFQPDTGLGHHTGPPTVFRDERWMLTPSLEHAMDGGQAEEKQAPALYASKNRYYPRKNACIKATGPYLLDGYHVICVYLMPLQYNPQKKELSGYGNIDVTIRLSQRKPIRGKTAAQGSDTVPMGRREGFANLLLNPQADFFDGLIPARSKVKVNPTTIDDNQSELIIIHDSALQLPAERLAEWKNKRGLTTCTLPIDEFGTDNPSRSERIKKFIRSRRGAAVSKLGYVLLFGDTDSIPPSSYASDHYYYTEKDAVQGECLLPWISGGRIPVRGQEEGMSVVDQIIRYEKLPPGNPDFYRRMTFAAYLEDGKIVKNGKADSDYVRVMERIAGHLERQGYEINRVYVSQKGTRVTCYRDGTPLPATVTRAVMDPETATKLLISYLNEGQLIIGHRDHGQKNGWLHPPFTIDNLDTISSACPSLLFSINCQTGRFQIKESTTGQPRSCFAEAILSLNGGAPSLIGSSKFSFQWRNDSIIKALFDGIWPGIIRPIPATRPAQAIKHRRLGDLLDYAKAYLVAAHGDNDNTRDQIEMFHVIGDPTLEVWRCEPPELRLRAYVLYNHLYINMNTCPRDAALTFWSDRKRCLTHKPLRTTTAIPLSQIVPAVGDKADSTSPLPLSVCFWAPGHRFAEAAVTLR